jgi:hypothetical protein
LCLSALVPGGDEGVGDKMKRFRQFVCARSDAEATTSKGIGTYFHPRAFEPFLDKFGDTSRANDNEAARLAMPKYVRFAEKEARDADARRRRRADRSADGDAVDPNAIEMTSGERAIMERVCACYQQIFMPANLNATQTLARLGYAADPTTASAMLKRARVRFHPDVARRAPKPPGVSDAVIEFVHQEIFKGLGRAEGN